MNALAPALVSRRDLRVFYIAWLDLVGDPVLATTYPGGLQFGAGQTGDPDLDGNNFSHVPASLVEVSAAVHQAGGADHVTATLSGLPGPDDNLLTLLRDRAAWQGRIGRLWHGVVDPDAGMVIAGYYTGYIVQAALSGSPADGGRVTLTLENYLAVMTQARNRSYQDQAIYDPDDKTGARIRAAANGVKGSAVGHS